MTPEQREAIEDAWRAIGDLEPDEVISRSFGYSDHQIADFVEEWASRLGGAA